MTREEKALRVIEQQLLKMSPKTKKDREAKEYALVMVEYLKTGKI